MFVIKLQQYCVMNYGGDSRDITQVQNYFYFSQMLYIIAIRQYIKLILKTYSVPFQ